ncbi:hypothetical protein B296_00052829 [Ensete ventricosum]|uniref:Uncharacterized protein n=1 Tax=Ensete ventricosum TaxID=4639 RepID=A0A426X190_ENSVE|nr:hypothetical protein B296_00052829 [Ensete ventricosum]
MDGEGVFLNLRVWVSGVEAGQRHPILQPLDLGQVAPDLVQFLFQGLAPQERFISLPLGLLELLLQLECTLLALGNRLRTSTRLQSIEFLLQLRDPIVHERDQPTGVMDSIEEHHLEVLALHETVTVRSSVKGKSTVPRHRSGTYQNHFLGG